MSKLFLAPVIPGVKTISLNRRRSHARSVIPISPRDKNRVIVIGRLEFLSSYYAACGCSRNIYSTRDKCNTCRHVSRITRFLSRQMLRFSCNCNGEIVFSVRGRFASVLIRKNDKGDFAPVVLEREALPCNLDHWRGSEQVHAGMTISLIGPGSEDRIVFEVAGRVSQKIVVYIVPFGQDLPEKRICLLLEALKKREITIAATYQEATHVVVSTFFKRLNQLAEYLGTTESSLQLHFDRQRVKCLLPQWTKTFDEKECYHYQWVGYSRRIVGPSTNLLSERRASKESNAVARKTNRNANLARELMRLSKAYDRGPLFQDEQWKALQFHKLAGRVQCLDFEINEDNFAQEIQRLKKVNGFGNSAIAAVQDILFHGRNFRAEYLESDPARLAISNLMGIHGVGRATALKLYKEGYDSIESLRSAVRTGKVTLDRAQQIGLDCYDDIQEEIPRDEVESIGQLVIEAFHSISSVPGEGSIMGSYRRGKASSGDVDILITMKDYPDFIPRCALPDLIRFLTEQGHIAQHITFFPGIPPANASDSTGEESLLRKRSESRKSGFTKSCKSYMGVFFSSKFPGKQRRVDIKIYPYNQKAFASLYFTGGKWFNRSMRLWATQKFNWKLTDKGLFEIGSGASLVRIATSEEQIFQKLRLRYKEPIERIYFDDVEPL